MMYWIKRGARILAGGVFFSVFIAMLLRSPVFELENLVVAAAYAFFAGITCWFIGIVISDIVIKGIITDIGDAGIEGIIEGGMMQRIQTLQEQLVPGGRELPFDGPVKEQKRTGYGKPHRDKKEK